MAGAPDLVPVQLTLGSSKGAVSDWVLWPVAGATEQELADFSASLCDDLGVPQQFRGAVAETIVAQVADWVANVPPLPPAAPPRRELISLNLVLGSSLRLRDQFWWDLHAPSPTPEQFAAELCADAGIDTCHGTAVAAAIRLELGKLRRSAPAPLPLPTPRIFEGAATAAKANGVEPQLQSACTRAPEDWQEWGPSLQHLSMDEARALQKQQIVAQAKQRAALAQRLQQAQAQAQLGAQQLEQPASGAAEGAAPKKKRQRGGSEPAPARRQLRPRRASRLAAILKEEEESDTSSEDSGRRSGGGRGGEQAARKKAAAGGRPAAGAGGSVGSGDYQLDEESLQQEELAEAAEAPPTHSKRQQGGQRKGRAAAAPPPPPQPAPKPPAPVAVTLASPVTHTQSLAAFQQRPQMPPAVQAGTMAPMQQSLVVGGASLGSLNVMGSAVEPGPGVAALPPGMVPQGQGAPLAAAGSLAPTASLDPAAAAAQQQQAQQVQMVGSAIVHYARELGIGEHKIQSFLTRPAVEQLALYRTLHQLVQQARQRQQDQLQAAVLAQQQQAQQAQQQDQLQAAVLAQQQQAQQAQQQAAGAPAPLAGMALPPLPLPPQEHLAQPAAASTYANLFSEMFD